MNESVNLTVLREIADEAQLARDVRIGPFCTIGPNVVIGPRTVLNSRVTVVGRTTIGADNVINDGCVLGETPQDLKYRWEPTYLILGDRNLLGSNVTANVGTEDGGYLTRIGNDNVLETGAHVAHDCYVDDHTHLGPSVLLAGHIRIQNGAVLDEMVGVHHFTTIGCYSRVAARTPVTRDVPPFTVFGGAGRYPCVSGLDERGIRAANLTESEAAAVRRTVRHLFEEDQAIAVKVNRLLGSGELPWPVETICRFCLQRLAGHAGRSREALRGKMPPEAKDYLRPDVFAKITSSGGKGLESG